MSRLNQLFEWECPICEHKNTTDFYSNESEPSLCKSCNENCDVYLDVTIQVRKIVPRGK